MNWVYAGLWGIAGGFVIEGFELYAVLRRHGCWPWQVKDAPGVHAGPKLYAVAETIRLVSGGLLASAAAVSGQVSGALAAVALGVGAPVVVQRLSELIPLSPTEANRRLLSSAAPQQVVDVEPESPQSVQNERGG